MSGAAAAASPSPPWPGTLITGASVQITHNYGSAAEEEEVSQQGGARSIPPKAVAKSSSAAASSAIASLAAGQPRTELKESEVTQKHFNYIAAICKRRNLNFKQEMANIRTKADASWLIDGHKG